MQPTEPEISLKIPHPEGRGMHLLYISSKKRWGGVSSWMRHTAIGLGKRGHRVWVLSHPRGKFHEIASHEVSCIPKKLGMDYNPFIISFLVKLIKSRQIDLVVTNIEKEVIAGGIAARLCGIPNIRRVGREDDFNKRFKVKWRHRLLVDHCIAPCRLVRDHAVKRAGWLNADQFTVIYNGRNCRRFSTKQIMDQRKRWGIAEETCVIGVTSQLSKSKGIDGLVRVFQVIAGVFPDCRLVITGEGPEKEKLAKLAKELGIGQKIVFAGFSEDPMRSSAGYDIAVSNSRFEGFPNNVVEYFAAERPVVTTDAGGVNEMAKHGENALLIPCSDDSRLYESIVALIQDLPMRTRLGRNAAETIRNGFSEDIMIDRLETFFLECIRTGRGAV